VNRNVELSLPDLARIEDLPIFRSRDGYRPMEPLRSRAPITAGLSGFLTRRALSLEPAQRPQLVNRRRQWVSP
jgi:hypothetical protein